MRGRLAPIEFVLDPTASPVAVLAAIGASTEVPGNPVCDRVYMDTFDGRLLARDLTAERSQSRGAVTLTVRHIGQLVGRAGVTPARTDRVLADEVEPGAAHDRITGAIRERSLLPQCHVRSRQSSAVIRNRHEKVVARVEVDAPSVVRRGRPPIDLRTRIRVVPVLGYDDEMAETVGKLASVPGTSRACRSIAAEAMDVSDAPATNGAITPPDIDPATRADKATVALMHYLSRAAYANVPGTIDDLDPEFLHDLRVSVRQARSVLREMKGVLPATEHDTLAADLKWIQAVTGPTRDLDVQLLDWPRDVAGLATQSQRDLAPLHDLLVSKRDGAWRTMRRHLRSRRFADASQRWIGLDASRGGDDAPNASRPIIDVAGARIDAVYRQMVKRGSTIRDDTPPEALHDLRKRGKELRYLLELFGPLWPDASVGEMVTTVKGLQDVLGRFQDSQVQAGYLRSLAPEIATGPHGAEALLALGLHIDRLALDQDRSRRSFAKRFATFASDRNQRLVERTFGVVKG